MLFSGNVWSGGVCLFTVSSKSTANEFTEELRLNQTNDLVRFIDYRSLYFNNMNTYLMLKSISLYSLSSLLSLSLSLSSSLSSLLSSLLSLISPRISLSHLSLSRSVVMSVPVCLVCLSICLCVCGVVCVCVCVYMVVCVCVVVWCVCVVCVLCVCVSVCPVLSVLSVWCVGGGVCGVCVCVLSAFLWCVSSSVTTCTNEVTCCSLTMTLNAVASFIFNTSGFRRLMMDIMCSARSAWIHFSSL